MRINVYAEELTSRLQVVHAEKGGKKFVGIRIYLELPVTRESNGETVQVSGPYLGPDDCSAAITIWGELGQTKLRDVLIRAAQLVAGELIRAD